MVNDNEFMLSDSGLFNDSSTTPLLQDQDFTGQFGLLGESNDIPLLQDPGFSQQQGLDLGGESSGFSNMFFDRQTGQLVTRQQAEALSAEMGGNPEAGLPQPGTVSAPTPKPGMFDKLFKQNPLLGLILLFTAGLGLAGVGQQIAGGGGKKVTQKTSGAVPRTPLEENLFDLANQSLLSGTPTLGGGNTFTSSAGVANPLLSALLQPRGGVTPGKYRENLLKMAR